MTIELYNEQGQREWNSNCTPGGRWYREPSELNTDSAKEGDIISLLHGERYEIVAVDHSLALAQRLPFETKAEV